MDIKILYAVLLGAGFGFALHRFGATNPHNLIKMVSFKSFKIMKVIFLAIALTTLGMYALDAVNPELMHFKPKASHTIGLIVGGLIFGLGFTVGGYCPGTSVAAMGEGRKDAVVYVLGGLLGAGFFTLIYGSVIKPLFFSGAAKAMDVTNEAGSAKVRLFELFGLDSGLIVAVGLAVMIFIILALLPKEPKEEAKAEA